MTDEQKTKAVKDTINRIRKMNQLIVPKEGIINLCDGLECILEVNKQQKAEIERLNVELVGMRGACESYKIHYDNAQAEIERLNNELVSADEVIGFREAEIERLQKANESFSDLGKLYSEIKSEAYKEFAERLEELIPHYSDRYTTMGCVMGAIRYTLKELTQNLHETCTEGGNEDGMD